MRLAIKNLLFMKKVISIILITVFYLTSFAQVPGFFSYQAVIRDNAGLLLVNQPMLVKITISNSSSLSSPVYEENHIGSSTNANGLLTLNIGQGTPLLNTFNSINWSVGNYYIFADIFYNYGGTDYTIQTSSQLASVPFALYAANGGGSGSGTPGPAGSDGKSVLSGLVNPDFSNGNIGDFYINTSTFQIFGPKTVAGWGNPTSLIGPQGQQGAQGPQGASGQGIPVQANSPGDMLYWNGSQWLIIPAGNNGQNLTFCNGVPQWGPCTNTPVLTTIAATSVTTNSAYCGGVITSDGGANVTERGICYATTPNPGLSDNKIISGMGVGTFTTQIQNLIPNTTYYVKAYAINIHGTAFGNQQSFTTLASATQPVISTYAISNITSNSASGGGNISNDGGSPVTARGICWGTTTNPTITANQYTSDGSGTGNFVSTLSGLTPATLYYVRAYATNSSGTYYGNQESFTTSAIVLPQISTTAISNVTTESATSGGSIVNNGNSIITSKGVCWSSTNQTPTISDLKTINGTGNATFISYLTGLSHSTVYHLRAYAITDVAGVIYGNTITFSTDTIFKPTLTTAAVVNPGATTAVSGGNISSDGGGAVTERGVCYSVNQNPIYTDNKTSDGTGIGSFISNISGLNQGTQYYIRAYAKNIAGISYGNQLTFNTQNYGDAVLTTNTTSGVTSNSAISGGNITNDGGSQITARGVCWSTSPNPNIYGNKTTNGSGTGNFTSNITGLNPATTYYVRAYATNVLNTYYGNQLFFTTNPSVATAPVVTTAAITGITTTAAVSGGNVSSEGGTAVTVRGVCWNTQPNPKLNNFKTTNGSGSGSFTSQLSGLTPNTTYYVRAYAINSTDTAFGTEINFNTLNSGGSSGVVTDIDGNAYDTVVIGTQVWLKQNLKTTKFSNGNPISLITDANQWSNVDTAAYSNFNNSTANPSNYGRLYNYFVVSDSRKVCPVGWHIPSQTEWNTLITYLGGSAVAGGKLKEAGITNWLTPNTGASNSSNFNAIPSGKRGSDGLFTVSGENVFFWTSTLSTSTRGFYKNIDYNSEAIVEGNHSFRNGLSIRCIKDVASAPGVTTSAVSNISSTTAVSGGNVTSDGGVAVTERGVCYSTTPNPTTSNTKFISGNGTGSFVSNLTGLSPNTTYNLRAYAINSMGTSYGNNISFITSQNSLSPVSDIDGNLYDTITIGTQVWMTSNLKTTRYRNGNLIDESSDPWETTISGATANYNNDSLQSITYGKLYNYHAIIDGRGVCPLGWKVPTYNDLIVLRDYLGGANLAGGKLKVAGTTYWVFPNTDATNQSGFTALPGGYKNQNGSYNGLWVDGYWWTTATNVGNTEAYLMKLSYNSGSLNITTIPFNSGLSVRCLKN